MKNQSQKTLLKYKRGQERDIVLEKERFDESVFHDQYVRGLRILESYSDDIKDYSLKTVVFCGGRGDGKTSCMKTVMNILNACSDSKSEEYHFLKDNRLDGLSKRKFEILDLIDPSFFDDNHNVLEIIIAHLYNSYRKFLKSEGGKDCDMEHRNRLHTCLQEVKKSLFTIRGNSVESINDLMELSVLSTSITLREQMKELVDKYLSFVNGDCIVVPIDDIDLNIKHAYKMCEQVRKYLCIPKCIVVISVKVTQLENVVTMAFKENAVGDKIITDSEIREMAKRYLNKLLPVSTRVDMPKPYELGDIKIEIRDGRMYGESVKIIDSETLKMALVQLIFYRTRYLFYNPISGSSPIVPNNMRDIFHMVGLLASMEQPVEEDPVQFKHTLRENKRIFKSYLFSVWLGQFDDELKKKLYKLVNFDFGTSFNREVIAMLSEQFEQLRSKDYQESSDDDSESGNDKIKAKNAVIASILGKENFSYNLSIGDVFYILSLLEGETLDEKDFALIFFLKSLYSIKLYEAYDDITENEGMVYPSESDDVKGLGSIDRRLDHVNTLQQLTGGSLFTYYPTEIIRKPNDELPYDKRIIRGDALFKLLDEIKKNFPRFAELTEEGLEQNEDAAKFNEKLQVVEFFILSIAAAVPANKMKADISERDRIVQFQDYARKNIEPFRFKKYARNTGYFLFDVLAPFANIINPQMSYTRFEQIDDEFYIKILKYPGSLLYNIIKESGKYRDYINYPIDKKIDSNDTIPNKLYRQKLHRLLSDAAIRNAEVLMAISNNIALRKANSHDGGQTMFTSLYSFLQSSGMRTLRTQPYEDGHDIKFRFLKPLQNVLEKVYNDKENYPESRRHF